MPNRGEVRGEKGTLEIIPARDLFFFGGGSEVSLASGEGDAKKCEVAVFLFWYSGNRWEVGKAEGQGLSVWSTLAESGELRPVREKPLRD